MIQTNETRHEAGFGGRMHGPGRPLHYPPRAPAASNPLDNILPRLEAPRRTERGWIAKCPAHEDGSPSLSIAEGNDGRVLLNCHAGCTATDITAALGLELRDLFPPRPNTQAAPRAAREYATTRDKLKVFAALSIELCVLQQYLAERQHTLSREAPDGVKPSPSTRAAHLEPWDRERLAVKRITAAMGVIYGR